MVSSKLNTRLRQALKKHGTVYAGIADEVLPTVSRDDLYVLARQGLIDLLQQLTSASRSATHIEAYGTQSPYNMRDTTLYKVLASSIEDFPLPNNLGLAGHADKSIWALVVKYYQAQETFYAVMSAWARKIMRALPEGKTPNEMGRGWLKRMTPPEVASKLRKAA